MKFKYLSKRLLLVTALFYLCACEVQKIDQADYGLEKFELKIKEDQLSVMESTVAAKLEVPAELEWKGKTHRVKVSYSGQSSLYNRKRSIHVRMEDGKILDVSDFRLSAQVSDHSFMRNQLGFEVYRRAGFLVPLTKPTVLYLNGNYVGLYLWIEEVDKEFFTKRAEYSSTIYKARFGRLGHANLDLGTLPHLDIGFNVVQGNEDFLDLKRMIQVLNEPAPLDLGRLDQVVERKNIISYQAVTTFLNHWDGFKNNFILYRRHEEAQLRWVPWDGDQIYPSNIGQGRFKADTHLWGSNRLAEIIEKHPTMRSEYLTVVDELLTSKAPVNALLSWIDEQAAGIRDAHQNDPLFSHYDLDQELEKLKDAIGSWHAGLSDAQKDANAPDPTAN